MNLDIWLIVFEYLEDKHKYLGICKDTSHKLIYVQVCAQFRVSNNYKNIGNIMIHLDKDLRTIANYKFMMWVFKGMENDNDLFNRDAKYITIKSMDFLIKFYNHKHSYDID